MNPNATGIAAKAARVQTILDLCVVKPRFSSELEQAINTTNGNIRRYVAPLLASGKLVKYRTNKGAGLLVIYATSMEAADHFIDGTTCIVRKTWKANLPPMFEPMAFLYGRAAC